MTESEQLLAVEKHFNNILPVPLPKNREDKIYWELIAKKTTLNTLKPLATVYLCGKDAYVEKVLLGFGLSEKLSEVEAEYAKKSDTYDITIAVKRGANIIAISKHVEKKKISYTMNCIPVNDQDMIKFIMDKINKQPTKTPLLIIKEQI